jgi:hypothetical protein
MSLVDDETNRKVAKFMLANELYCLRIYYQKNMDLLNNYDSPMSRVPSETIMENAEQMERRVDISYNELKIAVHPEFGVTLLIYEGNRVRVMCILKPGVLNDTLKKFIPKILEEFCDAFEGKYRKELANYDNYTGDFTDLTEVFQKTFDLDMGLPHIVKFKGFDPEDQLEQYIFGAADEINRTVGYFYLPNLIYLTKQYVVEKARQLVAQNPKQARKQGIDPDNVDFPPDEDFYAAIFNLKKIGMLMPIATEELRSYSKIKYPAVN